MNKPVCVVVGVGPGNGAAFARRFAREGYALALLARTTDFAGPLAAELGDARAYACDAGDVAAIERTFAAIRRDLGDVELLVHNAGSGVWGTVEQITPADFDQAFKVNALGALAASQAVIAPMKAAGKGSILFVGATASRRGGAKTAAFAPAKAAQRSLAESMARHLWPAGIHVALIMLDGIVATPGTLARMPDKPASFFIQPDDVAETAMQIVRQPRSVWSFEVEARPFAETW